MTRLSYDILGTLAMDEFTATVRVARPGRTIELVESVLTQRGRPAVVLRAWLMQLADTTALSGTALPGIEPAASMPAWDPSTVWPGGFIASAHVRRNQQQPARYPDSAAQDVAPLCRTIPMRGKGLGHRLIRGEKRQ